MYTCGDLDESHIGKRERLAGWVDTIRDHGGITFIDLRDQYGITQVTINNDNLLENVHKETVISVEGTVVKRDSDTINSKIKTGTVELRADTLEILGLCKNSLPFDVQESHKIREEVRLKYRFLDLRNPKVHGDIMFRSEVISFIRKKMESIGFTEINTPILTCSSPEGARDYIIPSRKHKGKFYALPQAPQQFKQLLMASGFDRYFQIAPCFRDEDSRADRSPGEFYQLDFEMAFATQEDVFAVAEEVLYEVFSKFSNKKISPKPFVKIPYSKAMLRYGTDKPDLRNPLIIEDLSDFFKDVEFKAFKGQEVRGIVVKNCSLMSNTFFEKLTESALEIGMKGLGYIDLQEDGTFKGPIAKFLNDEKKDVLKISLKWKQMIHCFS
jgi:aspartyl-tRNA synthetase